MKIVFQRPEWPKNLEFNRAISGVKPFESETRPAKLEGWASASAKQISANQTLVAYYDIPVNVSERDLGKLKMTYEKSFF